MIIYEQIINALKELEDIYVILNGTEQVLYLNFHAGKKMKIIPGDGVISIYNRNEEGELIDSIHIKEDNIIGIVNTQPSSDSIFPNEE